MYRYFELLTNLHVDHDFPTEAINYIRMKYNQFQRVEASSIEEIQHDTFTYKAYLAADLTDAQRSFVAGIVYALRYLG